MSVYIRSRPEIATVVLFELFGLKRVPAKRSRIMLKNG